MDEHAGPTGPYGQYQSTHTNTDTGEHVVHEHIVHVVFADQVAHQRFHVRFELLFLSILSRFRARDGCRVAVDILEHLSLSGASLPLLLLLRTLAHPLPPDLLCLLGDILVKVYITRLESGGTAEDTGFCGAIGRRACAALLSGCAAG